MPLEGTESLDTDRDGTGNNADSDDDNDGIPDALEIETGRNPLVVNIRHWCWCQVQLCDE